MIKSPTAEWWARHSQTDFIQYVLAEFPEVADADGEALANCLATLVQGRDLSPEQENTCRWWDDWIKRLHQGCFASIVGVSLSVRDLPVTVHDELMEACQRLRRGEDMTPRQASLWGHHVVKRWDAESRRGLRDWNRNRPSFRQRH